MYKLIYARQERVSLEKVGKTALFLPLPLFTQPLAPYNIRDASGPLPTLSTSQSIVLTREIY